MKTEIVPTGDNQAEPRVLLVDDDPNIRMLLRECFEESGFSVNEADGGVQALQRLQRWWPDAVLLDVRMSEMDGFDTCHRIRQLPGGSSLPVLMLTGLSDDETLCRAYEVGATDVMAKPPNWQSLLHRMRWLVDYSRALRRLSAAEAAQREAARHATEPLFRALVEKLPLPLMILNPDGSVRYENRSVFQWFGQIDGRPESCNFLERVHLDDRQRLADELLAAIHHPRAVRSCEFRMLQPDGSSSAIEGTVQNLLHDKSVQGILLLCQDMTKRKELEARLSKAKATIESSDQAKSEYLAIISHELRSPLNMILGHTELMLDDMLGTLSGKQMESLLRIRKSARELLELIFSLLDVTRLEGGVLPVEMEEVSVPELLRQMEPEFNFLQDGSEVDFIWRIDVGLWAVLTDRCKLMVVIRNLIQNAFKYTERGSVTLSAHNLDPGYVEISVADTGSGVPPDRLEDIFEPFSRLERSDRHGRQGAGLGLYVVKQFSDLIGARIEVESTVGRGSDFRLIVPGAASSRPATKVESPESEVLAPPPITGPR